MPTHPVDLHHENVFPQREVTTQSPGPNRRREMARILMERKHPLKL
jgi:hypothetical protein